MPTPPEAIPSLEARITVSSLNENTFIPHTITLTAEDSNLSFSFNRNHLPVVTQFLQLCIFILYRFKTIFRNRRSTAIRTRLIPPLIRICQELIDNHDNFSPNHLGRYVFTYYTRDPFFRLQDSLSFKDYLTLLKTRLTLLKSQRRFRVKDRMNDILYGLDTAYSMVLCYTRFFHPLEQILRLDHPDINKVISTLGDRFDHYKIKLVTRPFFVVEYQ